MQKAVDAPVEWGRQAGLAFSPAKTVDLREKEKSLPPPPNIIVGETEIPFSDKVRYLGRTFDKQLR